MCCAARPPSSRLPAPRVWLGVVGVSLWASTSLSGCAAPETISAFQLPPAQQRHMSQDTAEEQVAATPVIPSSHLNTLRFAQRAPQGTVVLTRTEAVADPAQQNAQLAETLRAEFRQLAEDVAARHQQQALAETSAAVSATAASLRDYAYRVAGEAASERAGATEARLTASTTQELAALRQENSQLQVSLSRQTQAAASATVQEVARLRAANAELKMQLSADTQGSTVRMAEQTRQEIERLRQDNLRMAHMLQQQQQATLAQANALSAVDTARTDSKIMALATTTDARIDAVAQSTGAKLAVLQQTQEARMAALQSENAAKTAVADARLNAVSEITGAKLAALEQTQASQLAAFKTEANSQSAATTARLEAVTQATGVKLAALQQTQDARIAALQNETTAKTAVVDARLNAMSEATGAKLTALQQVQQAQLTALKTEHNAQSAVADARTKAQIMALASTADARIDAVAQATGAKLTALQQAQQAQLAALKAENNAQSAVADARTKSQIMALATTADARIDAVAQAQERKLAALSERVTVQQAANREMARKESETMRQALMGYAGAQVAKLQQQTRQDLAQLAQTAKLDVTKLDEATKVRLAAMQQQADVRTKQVGDETAGRITAELDRKLAEAAQQRLKPEQVRAVAENVVSEAAPQFRAIALQTLSDSHNYIRTVAADAIKDGDPTIQQALADTARKVVVKDDKVIFAIRKALLDSVTPGQANLGTNGTPATTQLAATTTPATASTAAEPATVLGPDHTGNAATASIPETQDEVAIDAVRLAIGKLLDPVDATGHAAPKAADATAVLPPASSISATTPPQVAALSVKGAAPAFGAPRHSTDWVALRQYRVIVHEDRKNLTELLHEVVAEAEPYTGPWQIKWKIRPENQDILSERFSLDAETSFEDFINYLAQYMMNDRGVKLSFNMFDTERILVVSD